MFRSVWTEMFGYIKGRGCGCVNCWVWLCSLLGVAQTVLGVAGVAIVAGTPGFYHVFHTPVTHICPPNTHTKYIPLNLLTHLFTFTQNYLRIYLLTVLPSPSLAHHTLEVTAARQVMIVIKTQGAGGH